jgi:putative inorganic carbon (hco3(-)) transporter
MNAARSSPIKQMAIVSTVTFFLFQIYQLDFFLHITQRVPGAGALRPTLILFALISILLISQKEKFKERMSHPVFKAYGTFILVAFLTLPFVTYPGSVVKQNVPVFMKAIVFLYFTALILDTEKRFRWAVITFVCCQVFRVLEPLYLNITQGYWGAQTWIDGSFANRLSGAPADVINPNELGFVIATVIPFLHYYLLPKGWLYKFMYIGLLGALLYALILTMSRGAFLALIVVGWIVLQESKQKMLLIVAVIGIAIGALVVMNDAQRDRYLSLFSSDAKQSHTVDGRVNGAINEFKVGFTRPIFGHGLGTSAEAKAHNGLGPQASHNMYAEIIMEVGLVGMFFFFKFIYQIYSQIKYSVSHLKSDHDFYTATLKSLKIVFWMFVVYSSNYWGLNQYYWYHFAGLVVALAFLTATQVVRRK